MQWQDISETTCEAEVGDYVYVIELAEGYESTLLHACVGDSGAVVCGRGP